MSLSAGRQGQSKATRVEPGLANASPALECLWQRLRDVRHPRFLDCGPVWQATVNVLTRRGAKLYVVDLISPARQHDLPFWNHTRKSPVFRPELFLAQLPEIPLASLSAIFCWHLLDLLPREALPTIVSGLFSYLQPGGVLFCLQREPYLRAGAEAMWWLASLTALAADREGNQPFPYPALTNREMERLVAPASIKTFLTRSGRREVLAMK